MSDEVIFDKYDQPLQGQNQSDIIEDFSLRPEIGFYINKAEDSSGNSANVLKYADNSSWSNRYFELNMDNLTPNFEIQISLKDTSWNDFSFAYLEKNTGQSNALQEKYSAPSSRGYSDYFPHMLFTVTHTNYNGDQTTSRYTGYAQMLWSELTSEMQNDVLKKWKAPYDQNGWSRDNHYYDQNDDGNIDLDDLELYYGGSDPDQCIDNKNSNSKNTVLLERNEWSGWYERRVYNDGDCEKERGKWYDNMTNEEIEFVRRNDWNSTSSDFVFLPFTFGNWYIGSSEHDSYGSYNGWNSAWRISNGFNRDSDGLTEVFGESSNQFKTIGVKLYTDNSSQPNLKSSSDLKVEFLIGRSEDGVVSSYGPADASQQDSTYSDNKTTTNKIVMRLNYATVIESIKVWSLDENGDRSASGPDKFLLNSDSLADTSVDKFLKDITSALNQ